MRLCETVLFPVLAVSAVATSSVAAAAFSIPRLDAPAQCRGVEGQAQVFGGRRTFLLAPREMQAIKASRGADPAVDAAIADLLRRAERARVARPPSVMDKTRLPPSGDRHDYTSLAPYWWPDPDASDGPWIRRDGEVNPARATGEFDRTALGRLAEDAQTFALAYFYSDDSRYAQAAAALVRTWFLDPATRMNPNMNFAQAVPGRETGRPEGVLDSSGFMDVIDAVGLIGPSGALGRAETRALEQWFSAYVDWMLTSANGRAELRARNNHGIWFDAQLAMFALFARRPEIAERTILAFSQARIRAQFDPSGALPAELRRTRSFHYSIYALEPALDVADLASCLGYDLRNHADADGRSLRRAIDFIARYRADPKRWPHPEREWPAEALDALLTRADSIWGPGAYPRAEAGPILLRYLSTPIAPGGAGRPIKSR